MGGLGFLAAALSPLVGGAQNVDFCTLLEARIVADDGQSVGRITPDTIAIDSLINPFGDHGSEFSQLSIFNQFGPYGGMFALQSPYNPNTFFPPSIIRDSQPLARLTLNDSFSPRVEPDALVAWLKSSAPAQCSQPTPTASPEPSSTAPPSTGTVAPSPTPTATPVGGTPGAETPTARPSDTAPPTAILATRTPRSTSPPGIDTPTITLPIRPRGPDACAVVSSRSTLTSAILLLPLAVLRLLRRRER